MTGPYVGYVAQVVGKRNAWIAVVLNHDSDPVMIWHKCFANTAEARDCADRMAKVWQPANPIT